jgi:IS5 family transposase
MFKILILQHWYNLSDDQTEIWISDRLTFQRFLGLTLDDKVPDAKTIWLFRESNKNHNLVEQLFALFTESMEKQGLINRKGSLVDATFIPTPVQRNTKEENEKIKNNERQDLWNENVNKLRQKDKDARFCKKNGTTTYGYKDNAKVDQDSKLIIDYRVTPSSVHDSQELVNLIDEKDKVLYADSAYVGEELHKQVKEKNKRVKIRVNEKSKRNKKLTDKQKANNKSKSKIRARVEHPFGWLVTKMNGKQIRTIGISRAKCQIGLKNLAYNFQRFEFLVRQEKILT